MLEAAALAVVFLALQASTHVIDLLYRSPAVLLDLASSTAHSAELLQQHMAVQQQFGVATAPTSPTFAAEANQQAWQLQNMPGDVAAAYG